VIAGGGRRRRWFVACAPLIATVAVVLGTAAPAWAHATLVGSVPAANAHVTTAPDRVVLRFDQHVQPQGTGLRVLDSKGDSVATGKWFQPDQDSVAVKLRSGTGDGAYVADYVVLSVDGHTVHGGIVFLVGNGSLASVHAGSTTSSADWASRAGQGLLYAGVLGVGGLAFFVAFLLAAESDDRRLLRGVLVALVGVAVVGAALTTGAQAALNAGGASTLSFGWSGFKNALDGALGRELAVQGVAVAACVIAVFAARRWVAQALAFYGALAAGAAFVLFGHATSGPRQWLAIPADIVHAVAATFWIGGLAGLVVVLTRYSRQRRVAPRSLGAAVTVLHRHTQPTTFDDTLGLVERFSLTATICVGAVLACGVALAFAEVGSWSAMVDTHYGRLLIAKIAVFALVGVAAAYNKLVLVPYLARRNGRQGERAAWRSLLSAVRIETLGVIVVLALTAVIANSAPPIDTAAVPVPKPFLQHRTFQDGTVTLHITPNIALANTFDVQFRDRQGLVTNPADSVTLYLTYPEKDVGPLITDMKKVGPGHFVLAGNPNPPIEGSWQVTLQVVVQQFNEVDASFVDTVR
jgi:copper transport protein